MRNLLKLTVIFGLALLSTKASKGISLSSSYSADNQGNSYMFDIETLGNALTLTSFDVDIYEFSPTTTKTYTVEMWYRSGGYRGHEHDQDDWLFNGSVTFNFTDESRVYVNRNLDFVDLEFSPNTKYGIYLYAYGEAAAGIGYKNDVSSGAFEDSNLRLYASGTGLGYRRFGDFSVNTDRGFVGAVNYNLAAVPDSGMTVILLGLGLLGCATFRKCMAA